MVQNEQTRLSENANCGAELFQYYKDAPGELRQANSRVSTSRELLPCISFSAQISCRP